VRHCAGRNRRRCEHHCAGRSSHRCRRYAGETTAGACATARRETTAGAGATARGETTAGACATARGETTAGAGDTARRETTAGARAATRGNSAAGTTAAARGDTAAGASTTARGETTAGACAAARGDTAAGACATARSETAPGASATARGDTAAVACATARGEAAAGAAASTRRTLEASRRGAVRAAAWRATLVASLPSPEIAGARTGRPADAIAPGWRLAGFIARPRHTWVGRMPPVVLAVIVTLAVRPFAASARPAGRATRRRSGAARIGSPARSFPRRPPLGAILPRLYARAIEAPPAGETGGARCGTRRRSLELGHLFVGQLAPDAAREFAELERPVAVTMETLHLEAQGLAHAPHLTMPALVDRDLDHRFVAARFARPHLRGRARHARLEFDAVGEPRELRVRGHAVEMHAITLGHAVARVHEVVREVAVVGEEQEAARVGVETADREEPGAGGHEFAERTPAFGITQGGDHADRLVQHVGAQRGLARQRAAVHLDAVTPRIHLGARPR